MLIGGCQKLICKDRWDEDTKCNLCIVGHPGMDKRKEEVEPYNQINICQGSCTEFS